MSTAFATDYPEYSSYTDHIPFMIPLVCTLFSFVVHNSVLNLYSFYQRMARVGYGIPYGYLLTEGGVYLGEGGYH